MYFIYIPDQKIVYRYTRPIERYIHTRPYGRYYIGRKKKKNKIIYKFSRLFMCISDQQVVYIDQILRRK